jgi:hypothetical protein
LHHHRQVAELGPIDEALEHGAVFARGPAASRSDASRRLGSRAGAAGRTVRLPSRAAAPSGSPSARRPAGFVDEAQELRRRLASFCRTTRRFPEFVASGEPGDALFTKRIVDVYDTVNDRQNRIEQPPQEIVCWTVTAMVAVEHAWG